MENQAISTVDFIAWKNDSVSKAVFAHLKDVMEHTLETMTSKDLIGDPNGLLRLNYLRGYADAIDNVLHIGDIIEQEGNIDD